MITPSISEVLVRGGDILQQQPNFTLVGRDKELAELSTILMKMKKRNLVLTGRGGVGLSMVVLGIQASKNVLSTPVDIVGKRLYWLRTDKIFESGNHQVINDLVSRVRQALSKTKDCILIVEDIVDFIRAAQNSGCMHLINALMGDLKSGKYQAIFETRDDDLGELFKCDGDIHEFCTVYEVKEPSHENLKLILNEARKALEAHHGISVRPEALEAAATLTEKYKLAELRAQPDAAITLLDQALTDYSRKAQVFPRHIAKLEEELKASVISLQNGTLSESLQHLSRTELESKNTELSQALEQAKADWLSQQASIRSLYKDMSDGEEEIRKLEDEIENLRQEQTARAIGLEQATLSNNQSSIGTLSATLAHGRMDTDKISELKSKIKRIEDLVKDSQSKYKSQVVAIHAGLELDESHVLTSFSVLSGIPVDKLNEDERLRLKDLEHLLSARVIGQDEPTLEIAKAVRRARVGLKMPNKPSGTFMFLGPSGVGKTELAKALADALSVPLLRFDMSEYMEKHAVAKLIGAPPGYEGYEHGGILTNAARRNPYSVVLFDEIEKAHADVFNVMLQLLDDARLTDSRGLTASFKDTFVIMTTNIGTKHFLETELSFDDAKDLALEDLREAYRPEFLGRFGGNIYCFKRLQDDVLLAIARKDLDRINLLISSHRVQVRIDDVPLRAMIQDQYRPREGARSILGFIDRNITSAIADAVLSESVNGGILEVIYDPDQDKVSLVPAKDSLLQDASP